MTTLKYASRSSIRSAAIDATSRNTGEGGESKENDINEGWIIATELVTVSRLSNIRK